MAFSMKQVVFVTACAVLAINLSTRGVVGEELEQAAKAEPAVNEQPGKGPMIPVLVMRQGKANGQSDIWWEWLSWPGMDVLRPVAGPMQQLSSPFTSQASQAILNLPFAQDMFNMNNQMGSQLAGTFGQFNPMNLASQLGGGGSSGGSGNSNPLSSLMGRR